MTEILAAGPALRCAFGIRTGTVLGPLGTCPQVTWRVGQLEVRVALHPLLEGHAQLHAGQVGADAPVDAETEGGVAVLRPVDQDLVGVGKNSGSRLAAGNGRSNQSPSFIWRPWKSKSSATSRAMVTGA